MKHLEAVELAVTDSALATSGRHGPLVELCRVLAAQMDAAGAEPSTRLTAAYLSALKDLNRAITATPAKLASNRLDRMRELHPRSAPSKKSGRIA